MNNQCTDKVLGMYNNTLVLTLLSLIEILSPKILYILFDKQV